MPKNAHFALNVETRDLDFLDARNEKRKIVEIPGNRDVETRRAATLQKSKQTRGIRVDKEGCGFACYTRSTTAYGPFSESRGGRPCLD